MEDSKHRVVKVVDLSEGKSTLIDSLKELRGITETAILKLENNIVEIDDYDKLSEQIWAISRIYPVMCAFMEMSEAVERTKPAKPDTSNLQ